MPTKTLLITLIPLAGFIALLALLWRHLRAERRAARGRDGADAFAGTHATGACTTGRDHDASGDGGGGDGGD